MKKPKFSIQEIVGSLNELDLGCYWFDIVSKSKKLIGFDNDIKGNGNGPYLELKCYSEYVKVNYGEQISKEEKKLIFPYCDYDTVDDFTDYLAEFIRDYFKSFKNIRVLKNGK